jgi:hypothetical protein
MARIGISSRRTQALQVAPRIHNPSRSRSKWWIASREGVIACDVQVGIPGQSVEAYWTAAAYCSDLILTGLKPGGDGFPAGMTAQVVSRPWPTR